MNFSKSVKPLIIKYMDRAFKAYDGHGAMIRFDNDLRVHWDFDEKGNVSEVSIESKNYKAVTSEEKQYEEILSLVKVLAEAEINLQEHRKKIDIQYIDLVNQITNKIN